MGGTKESYSSNTNHIYEPDKVKASEIEARKEIEVKKMEGKNIELRKKAAIELIETNARMEQLIIKSKVEGFATVQNMLLEMTREINNLEEQRILMLETASGEALKEMNNHYYNFSNQINKDSSNFMLNEVPSMLEKLELIDKNSPAYKMYQTQLDKFIANFLENKSIFIKQVTKQQQTMLDSNVELRNSIVTHTNKLVENRIKHLETAVDVGTQKLVHGEDDAMKQIEQNENITKMIE